MSIQASQIIASVRSALDAEGSEYYLDSVEKPEICARVPESRDVRCELGVVWVSGLA